MKPRANSRAKTIEHTTMLQYSFTWTWRLNLSSSFSTKYNYTKEIRIVVYSSSEETTAKRSCLINVFPPTHLTFFVYQRKPSLLIQDLNKREQRSVRLILHLLSKLLHLEGQQVTRKFTQDDPRETLFNLYLNTNFWDRRCSVNGTFLQNFCNLQS